MGEEIAKDRFVAEDFNRFSENLTAETNEIVHWFRENRFSCRSSIAGLELEAWIIDSNGLPAAKNSKCLQLINQEWAVPELAQFNIELNVDPQHLADRGLHRLHQELLNNWRRCNEAIAPIDLFLVMIGILPTVTEKDLCLKNMSAMNRYKALNRQVLRARQGRPLRLEITGREKVQKLHRDVMLESAATSFQLHLQVPNTLAKRYYNASVILAAPQVALAANSPFLFGKDVWDETRIPLFEQAVEVGGYHGAARGPVRRVTFGSGYIQDSLSEIFKENLDHYPVLLPMELTGNPDRLPYLRLHNGTIWRWNRPLIGFDEDGRAHTRIEHRVMPAGPTVVDMIANAAFYYGLAEVFAQADTPPERQLPFSSAKDNFYLAARSGLSAVINWIDGRRHVVTDLILKHLLPQACDGLQRLQVAQQDIDFYLGIIEQRVKSGQNGTAWQRRFAEKYGRDMQTLIHSYRQWQCSERPVHEWQFDSIL